MSARVNSVSRPVSRSAGLWAAMLRFAVGSLSFTGAFAADVDYGALERTAGSLRDRALAGSKAFAIAESLSTEIGPRPAGGPAAHRAADWALAQLKALGFDRVSVETYPLPVWTRGAEAAQVVTPFPQPLAITGLGGSVATAPEGLEAPVALFRTYEALLAAAPGSLQGKIAVVTQPTRRIGNGSGYFETVRMRSAGASEAARRGAVAYLVRSIATGNSRLPHTGGVRYAADAPQIPAAALAVPDAQMLERMIDRGVPVRLRLALASTLQQGEAHTVVGDLIGRERPEEIVLLGAHFDTWDLSPGAADDAAGVGIVTAAAAKIARLPQRPRRTLRVALFGAEEVGGSAAPFAAAHAGELHRHVIASESDSGAARVIKIQLPRNAWDSDFGRAFSNVIAPLDIERSPQPATYGGADLAALQGVPLASLEQDLSSYFDIHHSADDTLDKIDPRALDQAVAAWAAFAYLAADSNVDFRSNR